jgi:hypothetical protein
MKEVWGCIVEGHGEAGGNKDEGAVRWLLRKLVCEKFQRYTVQFKSYNARGRDNLLKPDGIERFLRFAFMESNVKAIIVVLDAETDCAKQIAQDLADRVRRLPPSVPVAIVVVSKCYEAWLIGGLCLSEAPEGIAPGGAKKMLDEEVRKRSLGPAYKETLHQTRLTAQMRLGLAYRRCRSFRRFVSAVRQLLDAMDNQQTIVTP